jgi:hypothetical protein
MQSPERGALMLVRIIAVALIGWAVVDFALYWILCSHNQQPLAPVTCVLKSLPFIAGVIFLINARALADWISDKLDL